MPDNTWKIQRSILFELDTIFSLLNDYLPLSSLSSSINRLVDSIPSEMLEELRVLLGKRKNFYEFLFIAGFATRTEFFEDYVQATLPIRKLTLQDVIRLTITRASENGIQISMDTSQADADQMFSVYSQLVHESCRMVGYLGYPDATKSLVSITDIDLLQKILINGVYHDQFWLWLDRFYYQIYQVWRQDCENIMAKSEERARVSLGTSSTKLMVDWLPQVNPLRFSPDFSVAINQGKLRVIFLVEPFELPDSWFVIPDGLVVTFADNAVSFNQFVEFVNSLSERLKALADPNRLLIMRIARQSSRDNTEIAGFLNVSRPTVSIHAKQLREAGLIETFEDGRSVRHEVVASEVRKLFYDLERFLDLPPQD